MPEIPMNIKDSSSDEEVIKAKMIKLTHTNWVQWSCQFEKYLPESSKSKGKNKPDGPRKKPGFKDKKKGKSNNQGGEKNSTQDQNTNKRFERIEKLLEKLKSNVHSTSVNATSESRELSQPSGSDSDAFISNEFNALIGKNNQELIYLDSGAGRTVVNNLKFLEDPVLVTKCINTFSNPVKITHQGTPFFKGIKIYLVYYVPNGPVNLLSISQLCYHGMKLISKRNLFVSRLPSPVDSIYALPTTCQDWHLKLVHPSDSYIKALLKDFKINGSFTHSSDCQVCHQAKIKNHPHSQVLPRADAPFSKIHMNTLQINPQSRKGYKYVLVLIDDYSRFNCI
ncbi:hypothetical protein O181_073275 [Austropuccinia psidii MF-1]|uniref:GAG-pre-integrase domain-containing protein n=1 Tax=Austropuccinia psidii MF-1 TaxID=1389203 RepID=A0A9Q3IBU7_9BASI|nr:hypothetical protein [Austropuccinia psidii MF-1]